MLHQVQQAARSSHNHLGSLLNLFDLAFICLAALNCGNLDAALGGGDLQVLGHLDGEFAGGDDHEGFHAGFWVVTQTLKKRKAKAQRLSGSGAGLSNNVLAGEGNGNGLFLNGEWGVNALCLESFDHVWRNAKVGKIHGGVCLTFFNYLHHESRGQNLALIRAMVSSVTLRGVDWKFWKKRTPGRVLSLRSRQSDTSSRIDLTSLAPTAAELLAHATASQLLLSTEAGRVAREAWSVVDQDELARASVVVLERYEALRGLLSEYADDPIEAMVLPLEYQKQQFRRMNADHWYERVATCFVAGGFLGDFFHTVAGGLPAGARKEIQAVLANDADQELFENVLRRVIEHDDAYRSRVSLWSRRLVGDTMLIARRALKKQDSVSSEDRYEPLFTDVITEHTRRLDRLGLTA